VKSKMAVFFAVVTLSVLAAAQDSKVRLFVTDEPVDFSSLIAVSHRSDSSSAAAVSGPYGSAAAASSSSEGHAAAYGKSEKGANARTVEIQADLMKTCPNVTVTNDVRRANYVLLFRRANGHRESMFAFGGLSGLALSSMMKVDGASLFESTGDMVYATKNRTVEGTIKEVCQHVPKDNLPTPIAYMSTQATAQSAPAQASIPAPTPTAVQSAPVEATAEAPASTPVVVQTTLVQPTTQSAAPVAPAHVTPAAVRAPASKSCNNVWTDKSGREICMDTQ
jgi:hypothetical protein